MGKNRKVIGYWVRVPLQSHELGGKIMTGFLGLRSKTYADLMDDDSEHKKAKGTK